MRLLSIHHIAIIAQDYERSKKFYTEVLGFEVHAENYRADKRSYKLDLVHPAGIQIELFSFSDAPARLTRPEASGLRHLAFRVGDLDAALRHLTVAGVSFEAPRVDEYTAKRFTFFSDPDGLPLELYED